MNYIQIGDTRIELTEEQVTELRKQINDDRVQLSDIEPGETFKIAGHELIVLEQLEDGAAVILKDLWRDDEVFSESNNNFDGSNVDELCREFEEELSAKCGAETFVEHTVDLTSDDGLKDYGSITRKVSLLTAEQYRKYIEILDKHKLDRWWWLATPHSTKRHDNEKWVKCVSPSGFVLNGDYDNGSSGVRPFCILKSNIFVSKEGE